MKNPSVTTKSGKVILVDLTSPLIIDDSNNIVGYRLSLIDISAYVKLSSHEKIIN